MSCLQGWFRGPCLWLRTGGGSVSYLSWSLWEGWQARRAGSRTGGVVHTVHWSDWWGSRLLRLGEGSWGLSDLTLVRQKTPQRVLDIGTIGTAKSRVCAQRVLQIPRVAHLGWGGISGQAWAWMKTNTVYPPRVSRSSGTKSQHCLIVVLLCVMMIMIMMLTIKKIIVFLLLVT